MRILRLRLQNLNSLTGTWELDFTHPAFTTDGIFAITGPTGAGKTTILDAICLALYGRTPRLDRVTKGGNEIMSRQTGECSAEVEFATVNGRFRCSWYQHRGRKLAAGALQPPKRELSEVESGKILASKANEVARLVEQCTGMDFDRFTRSMLLAQGGFAAFLQANQDERAPILEQITGSEIYTAISKQVHTRFTEERDKQERLKEKTGAMQLLTTAEAAEIQQELDKEQQEEARLGKAAEEKAAALAWLDNIKALQAELTRIKEEQQGLAQEEKGFANEKQRLQAAQQALVLEGDYGQLVSTRKQQQEDEAAVKELQPKLPKAETALAAAEQQMQQSNIATEKSRQAQELGQKCITKVRALDLRIKEKDALISKDRAECAELEKKNIADHIQYQQVVQEINTAEIRLKEAGQYLADHRVDEQLVAELTGLGLLLERLTELDQQHGVSVMARDKAEQLVDTARQQWTEQVESCSVAEKQLEQMEQERQEVQNQVDVRLDNRTVEGLRREQGLLTEQRNLLVWLLETVQQKELLEQGITKLQARQKELKTAGTEQAQRIRELRNERDRANRETEEKRTQVALASRIRDLEEERQRLRDQHPCPLCGSLDHPFAQGNIPALDLFEQQLQDAQALARKAEKALSAAEVQAARIEQETQHLTEQIRTQKTAVQEAEQLRSGYEQELAELTGSPENDLADQSQPALTNRLTALKEQLIAQQQQLDALEQLDRKLSRVTKALEKQQAAVEQARLDQEKATHSGEKAALEQKRLIEECRDLEQQLKEQRNKAEQALAPYGPSGQGGGAVVELRPDRLNDLLNELTTRRDQWLHNQQEREATEKKIAALQTTIKTLQAGMETRSGQIKADEQAVAENCQERQGLAEERFRLFADRNPDTEERQLAETVRQAEARLQKDQQEHGRLLRERDLTTSAISSRETAIAQRKKQLTQLETGFAERLRENDFADEAAWQAACLAEEERLALAKKADGLHTRKTQLDERLGDRQTRLVKEEERQLTEAAPEELGKEHEELITARKQATERIGSLGQQLQTDKQQRAQQRDLLHSLEAQKKECLRWKELHDLIGSADGKKYRNFAQGLTFERMVSHANQQLARMTDRYLLVRDQAQPLELNVIDSWQAGEVRSTKNLSGGESFVVSLALALGLSEMVGGNVRVDSLFLDEGFGALDEDALETALETLAGLRREGKLIGVISHVSALKERIACQLEVIPGTGGQSVVQGAGVRLVG